MFTSSVRLVLLLTSSILIIFIVVFLLTFHFSEKINVSRDAVVIKKDGSTTTLKTTLEIKGTLYKPIFRQKKFVGHISIAAFDFTKSNLTTDLYIISRKNKINYSMLLYKTNTFPLEVTAQGILWFNDNFENFNILAGPLWDNKDLGTQFFIVSGSNYSEALDTLTKMKEKFGSDFAFLSEHNK